MRVVQFLASKGRGGLENVFVTLCNELSKTTEIDVIVFHKSAVIEKFDRNIRVHLLYANPSRFNPLLYIELFVLMQKLQPDVMHTHSAKATQIFYLLNKILHFRHVATKHNSRKGNIFNKLHNVIAVSEGVSHSISSDTVKVIYNGMEPVKLLPPSKDKVFTILAVGRLDKIKGFDILIQECVKLDVTYRLHIIGEGEQKALLESLVRKLKLDDKVSLLGFREDIPQLMRNADVAVVSSHSEGFSLVMIEALFYANLFISTKVSGATEILDDKFLIDDFNIATKINHIYLNYEEYQKEFSQLQNKLRNRFLLEHVVDKHIAYYNSMTGDEDDIENT